MATAPRGVARAASASQSASAEAQASRDRLGPRELPSAAASPKRAVSFVVPALNEEENVADTVNEVHRVGAMLEDYEIVLVDDGSTDRTGALMERLAATDGRLRVIHNPRNLGLGAAYKVGVAQAAHPYVIMIPGDNNHPAEGIVPVVMRLGQADIIIPYVANPEVRHFKRRLISNAFRWLLNLLFGLRVPYYNGLVLHRADLLRTITIETNGFAYQAEALVKLLRRGASSIAVPVAVASRGDRSSRAFRLKNVITVAETIWRLMGDR